MATARARTTSTAKSPARSRKAPAKKTAKKTTAKKTTAKKTAAKKPAPKKTSAKKTAAKQPASKPARYPFPFLGAGLASYFEWGGLYVWFEDPPPRSARAKLLKKIPEPFRHDAEWGGSVLHASSGDQFTNLHICSAYARLGDPDDPNDDDDDDFDGFGVGQPFPNSKQSKAFEADINKWLLALHRDHPIAFVARREDGEAGGTELDAWHRWSLTRFADVILPRIEEHIRKPGPKLENWAVHEALDLAQDAPIIKIPTAVKAWLAKDR